MTLEGDPNSEIDEFLERAVERQLAEQRSLTEHIAALTDAVNSLVSGGGGGAIDPNDLTERVRTATRTAIDPIVSEMRILADSVAKIQRAPYSSTGMTAPAGPEAPAPAPASDDITALRASVGAVSADVEGIAQALIDLNGGLRDWAMGVDRSISGIADTVERVRELASRAEVQRVAALESTQAQPALPPVEPDVAQGEVIDYGPVEITTLDPSEVEDRMKESVELSLYLADRIEEFDRILRGMGDLPQKLESVVAQGVRRTLTARAKLDTEATVALDDALASLDEYVDKMSKVVKRFGDSEETLRRLGSGQGEIVTRIDALTDALRAVPRKAKPTRKPTPKTTKRSTARKPKD